MHILIIGDLTQHYSGWRQVTDGLTGELSKNHKVSHAALAKKTFANLFNFRSLHSTRTRFSLVLIVDVLKFFWLLVWTRPDHIIIIPEPLSLPVFCVTRLLQIPYSIFNSGTYSAQLVRQKGLGLTSMRNAHSHFAASSYTSTFIMRSIPEIDLHIVGCGYADQIYKVSTNNEYQHGMIIFNGNMKPRKGLHVLQTAIELLSQQQRCNCELVLVGKYDSIAKKNLFKWSKAHNINLSLFENISSEELAVLYRTAMVNVLPSINDNGHFEGFGIVHSEAIASGTFTIGSTDCGNTDAITSRNGLCIEQNNSLELSKELAKLLKHKKKLMPKGEKPLTWADVCSKIENVLTLKNNTK